MYLVPLQYDEPPPPQLLPFNGPGLWAGIAKCIFLYFTFTPVYMYMYMYFYYIVIFIVYGSLKDQHLVVQCIRLMFLHVRVLHSFFSYSGLPINRRDTFLCIMTKMKFDHPATPDTPRKRKYSGKVHFSGSSPKVDIIPPKKPRLQARASGIHVHVHVYVYVYVAC